MPHPMRAFINHQMSYKQGVKNKVTSEGALSILFNSLNFNKFTTKVSTVNEYKRYYYYYQFRQ